MITITNWSDGTAIYSGEAVDLRDAVRRAAKNRVSLEKAELSFVDLSGADLRRANLNGANLRGANLYGANLNGASLLNAKLYGADLRDAAIYGAMWAGVDLNGVLGVKGGWDGQVESDGGMSNTARVVQIAIQGGRIRIDLEWGMKQKAWVLMERDEVLRKKIRLGDTVLVDETDDGIEIRIVQIMERPSEEVGTK